MFPLAGASAAAVAVLGPFAAGACLGVQGGLLVMLKLGGSMALICGGIAALMLPALYILSAFAGVASTAGQMLDAARAALADSGLLLLGLSPALLFLITTSTHPVAVVLLFHAALAVSVLLSLRGLYRRAFPRGPGKAALAAPLFVLWSLVGIGLGERMIIELLTTTL